MNCRILAIDQGTTGSRALLVTPEGRLSASQYTEYPQHFPKPGWVEHEPADLTASVRKVCSKLLTENVTAKKKISAIGITNQRETVLVWDRKTGKPLNRAIVWQDRRTSDFCEHLIKNGQESLIRKKTGLVCDPYFSASKIHWLIQHVPGLKAKVKKRSACFGTVDTWLLWNMTGGSVFATDQTNASRTMLYDIRKKKWDDDLLQIFGVHADCLPEVKNSAGLFGTTVRWGGIPAGVPITGIAGDQQAALFGQSCYQPGTIKNTYGTGAFLVLNLGKKWVNPGKGILATLACDQNGSPVYALEGAVFIAGAVIQWLRDGMGIIASASETEKLARQVPDAGGVTMIPAFTGLGAPWWDSHARGAIFGLTRGTNRAHLVRAALEAIAFQTRDVFEAMRTCAENLKVRELKVDGGATKNSLLMQMQADLLGISVARSSVSELTGLGAAMLASRGAGLNKDGKDTQSPIRYEVFKPKISATVRKRRCQAWNENVQRLLSKTTST